MTTNDFRTALVISPDLTIVYQDEHDEITERDITVKSAIKRDGAFLVIAHCKRRNAQRSFRLDRILFVAPTANCTHPGACVPPGFDVIAA